MLSLYVSVAGITEQTADQIYVIVNGPCKEDGEVQNFREIQYEFNGETASFGYCIQATTPVNYIGSTLTFKMYIKDTNGNLIQQGDTYGFSMEDYFNKLTASTNERVREVGNAVLCYGKAAANYFNCAENAYMYDISDTVADMKSTYGLSADKLDETFGNKVPTFTPDEGKVSLVLDTKVALRCYCTYFPYIKNLTEIGGFPVLEDKNGMYFEVSGISPNQMLNYGISFSIGDTTFNYCCLTWPYRVLSNPDLADSKLGDLAVGFYAYAKSVSGLRMPS